MQFVSDLAKNYPQIPPVLGLIGLIYSIHDSTEAAIQKMIEGDQRMIRINNSQEEEPEIPIDPAMKRHFELEI